MKRFLVLTAMLVFVGSVMALPTVTKVSENSNGRATIAGLQITPSPMLTFQKPWVTIGTGEYDNEPNDINILERTYLTVKDVNKNGDSKIYVVRLAENWNEIRIRCIGENDNCDVNYIVYSGALGSGSDCSLTKVAKLEFKIGKQHSDTASYHLADTLTVTKYAYNGSIRSVSPENDYIAECKWDLQGDDVLVVIPTLSNTTSKLIAKGY
jgi:hypothetical protein